MKNVRHKTLKAAWDLLESPEQDEFIEELHESVSAAINRTRGEKVVEISSAIALTNDEKDKLTEFLKTRFNKDFEFVYHVNPSLIGGFKVKIGDWRLDGSIAHQLELLKRELEGK